MERKFRYEPTDTLPNFRKPETYEEAVEYYVEFFRPHHTFIVADKSRIECLIAYFMEQGDNEKSTDLQELLIEANLKL